MEPGHLVDHSVRCVSSDVDLSAVWSDGEEVRGAIEGGDGHPAAVPADRHVLHTSQGGSTEQAVEMVDSCL